MAGSRYLPGGAAVTMKVVHSSRTECTISRNEDGELQTLEAVYSSDARDNVVLTLTNRYEDGSDEVTTIELTVDELVKLSSTIRDEVSQ